MVWFTGFPVTGTAEGEGLGGGGWLKHILLILFYFPYRSLTETTYVTYYKPDSSDSLSSGLLLNGPLDFNGGIISAVVSIFIRS